MYIIDTETASLQGGVVELAYLKVDETLSVLEEFCTRVNPEVPISPQASEIHGIFDADVANCKTIAEVTTGFTKPVVFIGHVCRFDIRVLNPYIKPSKTLDTCELARLHVKGVTNHKLSTLKSELGLPDQKSHSALGDVHTVRDLLLFIMSGTKVDFMTLLDRANQPRLISKMPFGKYSGVPILKVPRDYRAWMLSQIDIDASLRFTLEKFKEL